MSTSHGVAVETDDYSLSVTQSASLSIKDIGKNTIGKIYEKITLSNKPDGNSLKISISIVKENDPLRQIECAAIISTAVLAPKVAASLAGLGGIGTKASQLIPAIK